VDGAWTPRRRLENRGFETFDGVGVLQLANLTLDEPEFEEMICEDGDDPQA